MLFLFTFLLRQFYCSDSQELQAKFSQLRWSSGHCFTSQCLLCVCAYSTDTQTNTHTRSPCRMMSQHMRRVTAELMSQAAQCFPSRSFLLHFLTIVSSGRSDSNCSSQQQTTDDAAGASSVSSTADLLLYWTLNPPPPGQMKNTLLRCKDSFHMTTQDRRADRDGLISWTAPHVHHHFSCHRLHFHSFPASFQTFILSFFPLDFVYFCHVI